MVDELELGSEGSPESTFEIDDTEGELVIKDSNDNEVARRDESEGTWVLDSVSTAEASVTNESLVVARTDADVAGVSAGTFASPSYGTVDIDERSEFSSDGFTPDKTGHYFVSGMARMKQSGADGDRVQARLQNVTDSMTVIDQVGNALASSANFYNYPELTHVVELQAGKTYEYQVRNADSSFDIDSQRGLFSIRSVLR